jgi:chorismate mutase
VRAASVLGVLMCTVAFAVGTPLARADEPSPLFALVDAAAQRLQTADGVAASKWTTGGSISDPPRERQVIDAVTTAARNLGVDTGFVQRAFRDQIDATVAVEYARFSDWKLDPASAPTTAPNLADSRSAIDALNHTMVTEIAAPWDSLHSGECAAQLQAARDAVVAARRLDDLYQRALASATRSYCR